MLGKPFQVLDGGGQEELVPGAGEAPQSEPDHRENMLGLAKERFDLLAFAARQRVSLALHQSAAIVARLLIRVARDAARRCVWAAFRLQGAGTAIRLARDIAIGVVGMKPAGGPQELRARADIEVTRLVIDEVGP